MTGSIRCRSRFIAPIWPRWQVLWTPLTNLAGVSLGDYGNIVNTERVARLCWAAAALNRRPNSAFASLGY